MTPTAALATHLTSAGPAPVCLIKNGTFVRVEGLEWHDGNLSFFGFWALALNTESEFITADRIDAHVRKITKGADDYDYKINI